MQFSEHKPIYLQIAEGIMDAVQRGDYQAEDRLPSVREYAARVEVNANTVMRSYDWLQQQEILYNKRGIGFFVHPYADERILAMRRATFFGEEAAYFFGRLRSFGINPDELAKLYRDYLSGKDSGK